MKWSYLLFNNTKRGLMAKPRGPNKARSKKDLLELVRQLEANLEGEAVPSVPNVKWTDAMVKCLLACRFETNKKYFYGNKSKAQLVAVWERTALLFNLKLMTVIKVPKLKNKFQAVKSEFSTLRWSMDKETGNATE
ncbi:hypothetical protein DYB30_004895 [Aphanomyces astaci]|uniref:Myb/SANT-like domain-containing protein n=1 Tax=Aphanomyces astaci TaxID=112090 RepID=A0A396ZRJ4_APHAT|nr:hypothetical protein DYB36_009657 [Aphanomyces astaci]RHY46043.1 hypothetical protein DYB34_010749 [Aphanomyces astaci]RHY57722.1 hypothetical protein DYB30_004895 [Aphanomyces astaci]